MSIGQRVVQGFENRFGVAPAQLVRAPGRVNLIGEHTDYNACFVMPLAIDRAVWLALRPRQPFGLRLDACQQGQFHVAQVAQDFEHEVAADVARTEDGDLDFAVAGYVHH